MATEFPVCVPYKSDGGGPRDDLWKWCVQWWEQSFPLCPIYADYREVDGQFCRSHSINKVVHMAGKWGVYVIADADTFMASPGSVAMAVGRAIGSRSLVYTHTRRWMLGPQDTAHVLSHGSVNGDAETTGPHENTYSGIFAINAALWDDVGGFDERFIGWGYEDWAFMWACSTLGEMTRVEGDAFHLWHPRKHEEEAGQPHYKENEALWYGYKEAAYHPESMRRLLWQL